LSSPPLHAVIISHTAQYPPPSAQRNEREGVVKNLPQQLISPCNYVQVAWLQCTVTQGPGTTTVHRGHKLPLVSGRFVSGAARHHSRLSRNL